MWVDFIAHLFVHRMRGSASNTPVNSKVILYNSLTSHSHGSYKILSTLYKSSKNPPPRK